MIRISKSRPPKYLIEKGGAKRAELEEDFRQGRSVHVPKGIYGTKTVKNLLIKSQHGKCCYCEGKFDAYTAGDVEHFRPKNGYFPTGTTTLAKPGYFWLAYEWENLYFSCKVCNGSFKRNHFPLTESKRVKVPGAVLEALNDCLFIDPGKEDPADHIEFVDEIPVGKTNKGETTIELVGLDRESLNEERRKALRNFRNARYLASIDLATFSQSTINEIMEAFSLTKLKELEVLIQIAKKEVKENLSPKGEFSFMLNCNV